MRKLDVTLLTFYSLSPGRSVGRLDECKRKLTVLTDKLHPIHNDYILSMREGNLHQTSVTSKLLPMYLSAQQDYCQDTTAQWYVYYATSQRSLSLSPSLVLIAATSTL